MRPPVASQRRLLAGDIEMAQSYRSFNATFPSCDRQDARYQIWLHRAPTLRGCSRHPQLVQVGTENPNCNSTRGIRRRQEGGRHSGWHPGRSKCPALSSSKEPQAARRFRWKTPRSAYSRNIKSSTNQDGQPKEPRAGHTRCRMSRGGSRQSRRPALPSPVRPLIGPGSGENWGAKRQLPRLFEVFSVIADDHRLVQQCVGRSQTWSVCSNRCGASSLVHRCLGQRSVHSPSVAMEIPRRDSHLSRLV
jgi:hypothetical protein